MLDPLAELHLRRIDVLAIIASLEQAAQLAPRLGQATVKRLALNATVDAIAQAVSVLTARLDVAFPVRSLAHFRPLARPRGSSSLTGSGANFEATVGPI